MSQTVEIKPVPRSSIARAAIRDIKTITGMFRGIVALSEELGEAEDVQRFIKEEEQRLSDLRAEGERLAALNKQRDGEAAARISRAEATVRQLSEQAESLHSTIGDREVEARKIIQDAHREAEGIIERAKAEARAAVATEVEKIKAKLG